MTEILETHANFYVEIDDFGVRSLIVTGPWSDDASARLEHGDIECLVLAYTSGFHENDLDFIDRWPIRTLRVLDHDLFDIRAIDRVADFVEELVLQVGPGATLDLSAFAQLKRLSADWAIFESSFTGMDKLVELDTMAYANCDLAVLSESPKVETLIIRGAANLETLDGVEVLRSLSTLEIGRAPLLRDIGAIARSHGRLSCLFFRNCPSIGSLASIGALTDLKLLGIANCGNVDSLRPLAGLDKLETLVAYEDTYVLDSDLTPLLGLNALRVVRMKNRKSYRPPVPEVLKAITRSGAAR